MILTDENFDKEINATDKFVLVDFFATWCGPCSTLAPILEKAVKDFNNIVLAKINVDDAPVTSGKFEIDRIPAVHLFKNGKQVGGFIGVIPETEIKKWLENKISENSGGPASADFDAEKKKEFIELSEKYAKDNGFQLNPDKKAVERIVNGIFANEKKNGAKYCPCRRVTGNKKEDAQKICPCIWHKDEIAKDGKCFCGLFVRLPARQVK